MVAFSKVFNECLRVAPCSEMTHHGRSCTECFLHNIYETPMSNLKYFLPLAFLPLFVKHKKLNRKVFEDTLKYLWELVYSGCTISYSSSLFVCAFRKVSGEFGFYKLVFLPCVLAFFLFGTPRLFHISCIQCLVETVMIQRRNFVTKTLANSTLLQTCLFMLCSSVILHGKQNNLLKSFWFLVPNPKPTPPEANDETPSQNPCVHPKVTCRQHVMQGLRNYLAIGLTMDTVKMLMRAVPADQKGFLPKLLAKLVHFRFASTGFLTAYITIYRASYCYFNQNGGLSSDAAQLLAGLLGGACYAFMPKSTILSYGVVLAGQVLLGRILEYYEGKGETESKIIRALRRVPVGQILGGLSCGYLAHTYCMNTYPVSQLGATFIDAVTSNKALEIRTNAIRLRESFEASK